MAIYEIQVIATNDAGMDVQPLTLEVLPRVKAYSNVVGGHFVTLGAPVLEFPEKITLREGSDGFIDLNHFNRGSHADNWAHTGDLPPGATFKSNGVIEYASIGEEVGGMNTDGLLPLLEELICLLKELRDAQK